jgi:hypothetical protein
MMKKLYLIAAFIFIASLCFAGRIQQYHMMIIGQEQAAGVTYVHELSMEDNAASTVVVNDGTASNWTAGANTSTFSTTTSTEGSRAFDCDASTEWAYAGDNWTSEQFTVTFYYYPDAGTAAGWEVLWGIGDGDQTGLDAEANEVTVYHRQSTDEIFISCNGNSGSVGGKNSTNVDFATSTWIEIELTITANSGWTLAGRKRAPAGEWTAITFDAAWTDNTPETAVFNYAPHIGSGTAYNSKGILDHFRMVDNE